MKNIIIYLAMPQKEEEINALKVGIDARCDNSDYEIFPYFIRQEEWMQRLSPWEAISQNTEFPGFAGGGTDENRQAWVDVKPSEKAMELLDDIITTKLPEICEKYNLKRDETNFILAGYSMAGLFCLWSMYVTDVFSAVVCCSGSLWYPHFKEFVLKNKLKRKCRIYLSLGKKEEKAGNPQMRKVGDATREIYVHLQQEEGVEQVMLEWNEGNHFKDVEARMAKGIVWIIR